MASFGWHDCLRKQILSGKYGDTGTKEAFSFFFFSSSLKESFVLTQSCAKVDDIHSGAKLSVELGQV